MSLAALMSTPQAPQEVQAWQFANVASHRDIIRRVQETLGIVLADYPLEPFDPQDEDALQAFLQNHAAMHQDFDRALGLPSYNLSEVDWQEPSSLAQWVSTHAAEHIAASAILGIS